MCKRIYRVLELSGYARIDLRLHPDGRLFVLEANANPNLSRNEDLSDSAAQADLSYEDLLQRILNLGMTYQAAWGVRAGIANQPIVDSLLRGWSHSMGVTSQVVAEASQGGWDRGGIAARGRVVA